MENNKLKFMDFCSGIGAGRIGLEKNGLECVGHSEIDMDANNTYTTFFGNKEENIGDLMIADISQIAIVTTIIRYIALALTIISLVDYLIKNKDVMKDTK